MRFTLFTLLCGLVWGQAADYANSGYRTPEGRENVARTLTAHDRDTRQRPLALIERLGIQQGNTVADVGTGAGYMLPHLSQAVGPGGRVIAEDIFPDFLEKARDRVRQSNLNGVEFVLGSDRDAKLPAAAVDLVLVLDAYHHFDYPQQMLSAIASALKQGGRLAIVEYYKNGFRDPKHIRMDEKELIQEVESAGFQLASIEEFNPKSQYLAIFRKTSPIQGAQ